MNSFFRALRLALRYRWTFGASVFSALMIAALWGGNIGTLYPFVEVALQGKSLHHWADNHVAEGEARLVTIAAQFDELATAERTDAKPLAAIQRHRRDLLDEQQRAELSLNSYRWARDQIVRPYLPDDPFLTLVVVTGALLAGTVIKGLFTIIHSILCDRLSQLATFNLRKEFYRRTLHLDLAHFNNEGSADLMNRFTSDMESVANGLNELFGKLVREPLKMVACMIGAGWVCWRLLFFSLILAPPAAWIIRRLARSLKRANRRAMEEMTQIFNILDETFQGVKIVKAFTMEREERRRFHGISKNYYRRAMRIAYYDALTRPLTELLGIMTICLALLAGAYLAINRETHLFNIRMCYEPLSLSMLLLFYGFLAGTSDPARKLSEVFSRIQRGSAAAQRIYQLLDREPTIVDPPQPKTAPRHEREVTLDNVSFHYRRGEPVLDGVSLRIRYGETVAIVGPNGCGKSTLANLLPRFYDVTSGAVRIDGVDVRDLRLRDLRLQIGIVAQETLLFDDTIFANIHYGAPQATHDEVLAAARQALAHEFIAAFPQGYETFVGPRGALLSGGQRQRIALARAILRDPALLILDEATSQVDPTSELLMQRVLEQFRRSRTTIIITHRLNTLDQADRIVVMNAGRIVDVGSQHDLERRCELFCRLRDIDFKQAAA